MPGLNGTVLRQERLRPGLLVGVRAGSVCWPVDIRSRSLTRIDLRLSLGFSGASSGKNLSTGSSTLSLPSAIGQPDGRGGEALAQRVKRVRRLGVVGRPPALGDDLAVTHEHEAVHGFDVPIGRLDELQHGRRGDALCLRRASGQILGA